MNTAVASAVLMRTMRRSRGLTGALSGVPGTTLSFHLKELAGSGLVTAERASRNLVYRAAFDEMNALLGYLTDHCCQGSACAVTRTAPSRKC